MQVTKWPALSLSLSLPSSPSTKHTPTSNPAGYALSTSDASSKAQGLVINSIVSIWPLWGSFATCNGHDAERIITCVCVCVSVQKAAESYFKGGAS